MNAKEFYTRFKALFAEESSSLTVARQCWEAPGDFTTLFINKYIPDIMKEKDDETEFEYFRIDIISYSQRKSEAEAYPYRGSLKPYLWDLKIAFEHENESSEWLDEIIKLSHVNAPLRVVIGYFTRDEKKRAAALDFAAAMLDKKLCLGVESEFLLIIGDSGVSASEVNSSTYTPYLFENGKFKKQAW